jgi:hypothetical protein
MEDVQKQKQIPEHVPHDVAQVMRDTGMDELSAHSHLKQRQIISRRIKEDARNKYYKA